MIETINIAPTLITHMIEIAEDIRKIIIIEMKGTTIMVAIAIKIIVIIIIIVVTAIVIATRDHIIEKKYI